MIASNHHHQRPAIPWPAAEAEFVLSLSADALPATALPATLVDPCDVPDDLPPPRSHKSRTSQAAAERAKQCQGRRCRQIIAAFQERGPLTRDEIAQHFEQRGEPMPMGTIDGRCNDLATAFYLIAAGYERPTRHGSPAEVLKLNPDKPYPA